MEKFKDKFRIESNRMPGWDYSGNGIYFITLVTQDRVCLFGEIQKGNMVLSEFGKIAQEQWSKSFDMRKELFLDEYIIMPNHLHAIIRLEKSSEQNNESTHDKKGNKPAFYRKPRSVSSFIAGYKSAVIIEIDNYIDRQKLTVDKFNRSNRLWQRNYYDHIIRDEKEYWRIKKYIKNNPENWKEEDNDLDF
ncbi:MAG: transposase [Chlorobi bacterium]|nr:transposase [Chlorobiota bacterium]